MYYKMQEQEQMLSIAMILAKLGIGRTTFHKFRKFNGFPEPALQINKLQRWKTSDVERWIEEKTEKKETPCNCLAGTR